MNKGAYIVALVIGVCVIFTLNRYVDNQRLIAVLGMVYLFVIVCLSKRETPFKAAKDSDICLSLGSLIQQASPAKERENHVVFYRAETHSVNVLWTGRFLTKQTAFNLSDAAQQHLSELFENLHHYYVQNRLGDWNVAYFSVLENKKRFDLKVELDHELSEGLKSFDSYMQRYM